MGLLRRPRLLGALCAITATLLGLTYMTFAAAPVLLLLINAGALAIGFLLAFGLLATVRADANLAGPIILSAGIILGATALLGLPVEGASRWIAIGGLFVQTSLIVLPLAAISLIRARGIAAKSGILLIIAALALQPDRAMAGAFFSALLVCAWFRRENIPLAVSAGAAFAVTLMRPDRLPAMPYVDQIYYTSFSVHPLAGLAVAGGALILLVPALCGLRSNREETPTYAVFGATWLVIAAAAALGNYPTPVVGYGGSAIVGYVLSALLLPRLARPMAGGVGPRHRTTRSGEIDRLQFGRL